ncbi:hypothetical protein DXG01_003554 [Tephrocybe rancida]|nr:hypothetical protein DXG01_003554 [Tephrocybe rancida]
MDGHLRPPNIPLRPAPLETARRALRDLSPLTHIRGRRTHEPPATDITCSIAHLNIALERVLPPLRQLLAPHRSGATARHARGLWGTTFHSVSSSASLKCGLNSKDRTGKRSKGGEGMELTAFSERGDILAVARSNTGFVHVYGADSFVMSDMSMVNPKPRKSIANLTASISAIRFNHDAQIMAVASQEKKDAMRLIHTPTLTSFANWPMAGTPLGHVSAIDFSARSEYVAIGNTRGHVLLYHLKDYGTRV